MKSILVVDDEYDIASALELVLSSEGYEVMTASNGKEALARIQEARPDLVFIDIMMPVLNGVEAIRAMKANPETRSIPVVLMSAIRPLHKPEERLWDAFLVKPFELDQILDVIQRLIGAPS